MKTTLNKEMLYRDLLKENGLNINISILLFIPVPIFIISAVTSVFAYLCAFPQWWAFALSALVPLFIGVLLFFLLGTLDKIKTRKKILNGEFTVVRDYCDNVSKHIYDDDGESVRYIWHFVNTESIISSTNPMSSFINKHLAEIDYFLVFINEEKQPRLFYSCEEFEYY